MSKEKFTPGPWSVLHGKEFDGHPYHNIYCTETGNIIAHAWGDYDQCKFCQRRPHSRRAGNVWRFGNNNRAASTHT